MLENYRSPGSRLGKRPFFELGVMLHGQAALSKCHCFQILRAKRDETIKEMKKRAWDKVHVDGTLSPWAPRLYPPRPGPAWPSGRYPGNIRLSSSNSQLGELRRKIRTYAKGWGEGEKAADWAQKHTCTIRTYVSTYVRTYVSDAPFAPVGFGPLVSCPSSARAFASPAMGNGRSPSHPL